MSKKSNDVVITAALRTPIGTYKGSLKGLSADKLGALAIKEAVYKSKLKSDDIDEVIMGHVLTSGLGQNPARQASIHAGIPVSKPAHIINQVCGSGLRSVISGYQSIKLGENKIIVAGGQENMSRAPHTIFYREDKKLDENKLVDTMINDGLIDSFNNYHMGITAENVAEKYKISRDEQDIFAVNSQNKAERAKSLGYFKKEITGIPTYFKKSRRVVLESSRVSLSPRKSSTGISCVNSFCFSVSTAELWFGFNSSTLFQYFLFDDIYIMLLVDRFN